MIQASLLIWLVGLLVTLLSPADIINSSSIAKTYVDLIKIVLPINEYSKRSTFPQVTILYNAIIWILWPILFLLCWRFLTNRKTGLLSISKENIGFGHHIFLVFVSGPIFVLLGLAAFTFWHGGDTRNFAFGSSRVELGLYGIIVPMSSALCLALGIASFKKSLTGKL